MTHTPEPYGRVGNSVYCIRCGEFLVRRKLVDGTHQWTHSSNYLYSNDDPVDEEGASV